MRTPSPCLCDTLRQTTRAITRMYDDALRPVKLRVTQYTVLKYIANAGEARVRDLGEAVGLEETTLTRGLKPLETQGWIQSRAGADRRERYVSLTPAGQKLLAKAKPLWDDAQTRMRERLSNSAWEGIFRTLPMVTAAAG